MRPRPTQDDFDGETEGAPDFDGETAEAETAEKLLLLFLDIEFLFLRSGDPNRIPDRLLRKLLLLFLSLTLFATGGVFNFTPLRMLLSLRPCLLLFFKLGELSLKLIFRWSSREEKELLPGGETVLEGIVLTSFEVPPPQTPSPPVRRLARAARE